MESSRIFVKGLPPTFTEAEFRKHFSQANREVTDAKIFPNRRIGYVGYKTPEDAQKAVKYFNRTFIRMSRIGVELARPIEESKGTRASGQAPTARRDVVAQEAANNENNLKRKRESNVPEKEKDPKLQEFLDVYKPKSKKNAWEQEEAVVPVTGSTVPEASEVAIVDAPSDGEYETVPKKAKRAKQDTAVADRSPAEPDANVVLASEIPADVHVNAEPAESGAAAVSDADWARSRTSRLLGLLDDDEEEIAATKPNHDSDEADDDDTTAPEQPANLEGHKEHEVSIPTPPADDQEALDQTADAEVEAVRSSMRLFVRNLPYNVQKEDLEAEFAPYGNLEEVSSDPFLFNHTLLQDES
jgi:multiple RNA-binding domain-containing protein 1